MKRKLFYAVAATMTLAACTAEEDLQVKQTQTSPIKFTVNMDGTAETRTEWGNDLYKSVILWTNGDLMSLFHGGENGSLSNIEDAIYEAKAGSSEEGLQFTTASMVKSGQAIMVYPADTTFEYKAVEDGAERGLRVKISAEQNADYVKTHLPFMSEGIDIKAYNANGGYNTAGYDRNYPIRMKQVGTTMDLTPNYTGNGKNVIDKMAQEGKVADITVSKIVLSRAELFNVELGIKLEDTSNNNWALEKNNGWNKKSNVDFEKVGKSKTLSVTGEDLNTVRFLLLPQSKDDEVVTGNVVDAPNAQSNGTTTSGGTFVKFHTYYGSVTLDDNDGNVFYKTSGVTTTDPKKTISEGLNDYVLANTWTKEDRSTSTFKDEETGMHINRTVDVDLTKLDMSDLHIKSDKHLTDVLLVWEQLMPDKDVILSIDGDDNERFVLSMENVDRLQKAPWKGKVTLQPCVTDGEKCSEIVLKQRMESVVAQKADKVPAIDFLSGSTNIVLGEGNWIWEGRKVISYVKNVYNEGNLTLKGEVGIVSSTNYLVTQGAVVNCAGATIDVDGTVYQMLNLNNYGEINIPNDAELLAYGNTITNDATDLDEVVFVDATKDDVCGKINNSGVLAVTAGTSGKICNYGYIMNNEGAKTYITTNQTEKASFAMAFGEKNKIGVIQLATATDNISVSNATSEGFIKYTWDESAKDENGAYMTPSEDVKYNYLIVKENITFNNRPKEVKYIEVNSGNGEVVITTEAANLVDNGFAEMGTAVNDRIGFILPANNKANVKEGNTLYANGAYIKGILYVGGNFAYNGKLETYLGGDPNDEKNIRQYR